MQWAVQPWLIIASDREAFPSLIYTARPPAGLIAQKKSNDPFSESFD